MHTTEQRKVLKEKEENQQNKEKLDEKKNNPAEGQHPVARRTF